MTIGDTSVMNVVDYGQHTYTWNGGVCFRCNARYVGSHACPYYWPVVATTVTYVPSVVDSRVDELLDEVKKLRKELKRARKSKGEAA